MRDRASTWKRLITTAACALLTGAAGCALDDGTAPDGTEDPGDPLSPPELAPEPPTDAELEGGHGWDELDEEEDAERLVAASSAIQVEGENMSNLSGHSGVYYSSLAPFGNWHMRLQFANGDIGQWFYQPTAGWRGISVAAQGSWCTRGWPTMQTFLYNGNQGWYWWSNVLTVSDQVSYNPTRYFPYWTGTTWVNAGWNFVLVRMGNDSYVAGYCDANLAVDYAIMY